MKIALIQRGWYESIGLMSLAALVKQHGHQVEAFIGSGEKDIAATILRYRPDIACFTCTTGEHIWAIAVGRELKRRGSIFTIFGGPHPTFFPDLIEEEGVDCVCRGEGEYPLLDLVQAFARGEGMTLIPNLYFKSPQGVLGNEPRALIGDLDSLPFPAREIYDKYRPLQENPTKHFVVSRGCPFQCSYCYNHLWKRIYAGKGPFLRFKSPEYALRELEDTRRRYKLGTVYFEDDVFIARKIWVKEFLHGYRSRINLPFICKVQANAVTEEVADLLAAAGCYCVSLGIETGDEGLRRMVLNKQISDTQIIRACRILKKRGIEILTLNMMALPGETLSQALKTVALNTAVGADHPWCSILQPYPNTGIEQYAVERGLLEKSDHRDFNPVFFKDSPLKSPETAILVRLQKYFYLAVKFPALMPLISRLIELPIPFFDHAVFLISFALLHKNSNRLSLREIIRFGWRNRKLYF